MPIHAGHRRFNNKFAATGVYPPKASVKSPLDWPTKLPLPKNNSKCIAS